MTPSGHKAMAQQRKVCAWCSTVITEGRPPTTHGMCEGCYADRETPEPTMAKCAKAPMGPR